MCTYILDNWHNSIHFILNISVLAPLFKTMLIHPVLLYLSLTIAPHFNVWTYHNLIQFPIGHLYYLIFFLLSTILQWISFYMSLCMWARVSLKYVSGPLSTQLSNCPNVFFYCFYLLPTFFMVSSVFCHKETLEIYV